MTRICYISSEDSTSSRGNETTVDPAKEKKAISILILSIDKSIFVHVATAKTAKEVWKNLKATYEDVGMG